MTRVEWNHSERAANILNRMNRAEASAGRSARRVFGMSVVTAHALEVRQMRLLQSS